MYNTKFVYLCFVDLWVILQKCYVVVKLSCPLVNPVANTVNIFYYPTFRALFAFSLVFWYQPDHVPVQLSIYIPVNVESAKFA